MKTLEELKNMISEVIENYKVDTKDEIAEEFEEWSEEKIDEEYERQLENYEEFKKYNFLSYNLESDKAVLCSNYECAKAFAEKGGQILVIDKEKVYNYKVKSDEEYREYLRNEIKKEDLRKMNYYGI